MTSLKKLLDRGTAEIRYETVSIFRNKTTHKVRAELWSQPGIPAPDEGEEEVGGYYFRYTGPVVCIQLHWGRWVLAQEEIPRVVRATTWKWNNPGCLLPEEYLVCPYGEVAVR